MYFTNNSASLVNKVTYLVSLVSSIKAPSFERNMHQGLVFFNIFVANEIFKSIFTGIDLVRYYYFINMYIFIEIGSFILVKYLFFDFTTTKVCNCFFHFYI